MLSRVGTASVWIGGGGGGRVKTATTAGDGGAVAGPSWKLAGLVWGCLVITVTSNESESDEGEGVSSLSRENLDMAEFLKTCSTVG